MKKKTKSIQFQINDPCHENWNKMHSLPGGRFCDSCEKTVVDFSEMTDNQVVRFVQNNNQKLCGRFRPDQLNREMAIPRTPSSFQKWKSAAAILAGLLTWNAVDAQHLRIRGNITSIVKVENDKEEKGFSKNKLKGIVKDSKGEPLIGATVLLEKGKGTTTDIDGKFELKIPEDWESFEVTFSYIGYAAQVIEFDRKEILEGKIAEVRMESEDTSLTEVEIVADKIRTQSRVVGLVAVTSSIGIVSSNPDVEAEKKEEILKIEISNIYPNPFVNFVTIKLQVEKESPYLFHLYNTNGQLIWAKTYDLAKGNQELRLDFSLVKMAQGHHFLRVTDGNREIQTKKIIKVNTKGEGEEYRILNKE